jgi:hypothetical protein
MSLLWTRTTMAIKEGVMACKEVQEIELGLELDDSWA